MTNINEEFEVYIIGVCLNEPTTLPKIMLDLKPNDFLTQNNRIIFSAICEMHNQKAKEIDAKTLISFISNNSSYKVDNCEQLIEEINSSYISSSKLDSYIVNQKVISANRKIKNLGKKMMNCEINVGNYQKEIDEINEEVKNIYSDVHTSSLKDISDITPIIEGRIDAVKKGINDHTVGVRSGFFYYDECTYGFINGSINVFAARPGVGKTAFMLNSVLNAAYQVKANSAKYDKPPAIIIFSLEMKAEELWNRLASIVCNKRFSTKFKKE
jgi:replicative DNA helicase